jgi:hypothetical protein
MRKIRGIAASVLMVAGIGLAAAPVAGAATVNHHPHHHAQVIRPHLSGGTYNIVEANGCCGVGSATLNAGEQVTEVQGLGRSFTFSVQTTYFGDNAGYFQFSNGNFMAANSNCTGVTIKSSATSTGTVWAPQFTGTTHTYKIVNRYCDQQFGSHDTIDLAGRSSLGAQYILSGDAQGIFNKMTVS